MSFSLHHVAGHDEQRRHFETLELGAQAIHIIEMLHVDVLLRAGDDIHRDVVIARGYYRALLGVQLVPV